MGYAVVIFIVFIYPLIIGFGLVMGFEQICNEKFTDENNDENEWR